MFLSKKHDLSQLNKYLLKAYYVRGTRILSPCPQQALPPWKEIVNTTSPPHRASFSDLISWDKNTIHGRWTWQGRLKQPKRLEDDEVWSGWLWQKPTEERIGRGWLLTRKEGIGEGNHDDKEVREQEDLGFNSQMVTLFQAMLSLSWPPNAKVNQLSHSPISGNRGYTFHPSHLPTVF